MKKTFLRAFATRAKKWTFQKWALKWRFLKKFFEKSLQRISFKNISPSQSFQRSYFFKSTPIKLWNFKTFNLSFLLVFMLLWDCFHKYLLYVVSEIIREISNIFCMKISNDHRCNGDKALKWVLLYLTTSLQLG